jgi:hypothetical protein
MRLRLQLQHWTKLPSKKTIIPIALSSSVVCEKRWQCLLIFFTVPLDPTSLRAHQRMVNIASGKRGFALLMRQYH